MKEENLDIIKQLILLRLLLRFMRLQTLTRVTFFASFYYNVLI